MNPVSSIDFANPIYSIVNIDKNHCFINEGDGLLNLVNFGQLDKYSQICDFKSQINSCKIFDDNLLIGLKNGKLKFGKTSPNSDFITMECLLKRFK